MMPVNYAQTQEILGRMLDAARRSESWDEYNALFTALIVVQKAEKALHDDDEKERSGAGSTGK